VYPQVPAVRSTVPATVPSIVGGTVVWTVAGRVVSVSGTWEWGEDVEFSNVPGTHDATATFTPDDRVSYGDIEGVGLRYVVDSANTFVSGSPGELTMTYGGSPASLSARLQNEWKDDAPLAGGVFDGVVVTNTSDGSGDAVSGHWRWGSDVDVDEVLPVKYVGGAIDSHSVAVTFVPDKSQAGSLHGNELGEVSATVRVRVLPAAGTVSWPVAAGGAVYGVALGDIGLVGGTASGGGGFAWRDAGAIPGVGGSATVVFTPADSGNYEWAAAGDAELNGGVYDAASGTVSKDIATGVQKATPTVGAGDVPVGLTAVYGSKLLGGVVLPDGWAWSGSYDASTLVGDAGLRYFDAVYSPLDGGDNWGSVSLPLCVEVTRATPVVSVPAVDGAVFGDALSTVALPDGWTWVGSAAQTAVGAAGSVVHVAVFTPRDGLVDDSGTPLSGGERNWNTVTRDVGVSVAPAVLVGGQVGEVGAGGNIEWMPQGAAIEAEAVAAGQKPELSGGVVSWPVLGAATVVSGSWAWADDAVFAQDEGVHSAPVVFTPTGGGAWNYVGFSVDVRYYVGTVGDVGGGLGEEPGGNDDDGGGGEPGDGDNGGGGSGDDNNGGSGGDNGGGGGSGSGGGGSGENNSGNTGGGSGTGNTGGSGTGGNGTGNSGGSGSGGGAYVGSENNGSNNGNSNNTGTGESDDGDTGSRSGLGNTTNVTTGGSGSDAVTPGAQTGQGPVVWVLVAIIALLTIALAWLALRVSELKRKARQKWDVWR
jgi:hypothetical protein